MLGHHPELVVYDAPAHRGTPRLSRFAADGFEHGHRQLPADWIDHEPLHAMDEFPLEIHSCIQRYRSGRGLTLVPR
ncbi:Uncharacterised protein [Mycobacterium tuberculosis]|nr:Uncharacterised protein [Mycobacterium tuberculosis]